MNTFAALSQLTDAALHGEIKRLTGGANTLTAQLLAHLGEVEARGIHRERACSSLYSYCVYELRMSEDEAQRRCRAARLGRQFPLLLEMLAEASLHLTGLLLIGPHLTEANQGELLARARYRTKREIERLVAEIAPCRDVPSVVEPLHRTGAVNLISPLDDAPATGTLARARTSWAAYVRSLAGPVRQLPSGLAAGQAPPRMSEQESAVQGQERGAVDEQRDVGTGVRTAAAEVQSFERRSVASDDSARTAGELRYRVQFTADQAYVDLLEEARNLLQHELPSRDLVEVQRRALELLVQKLRQRKHAASERPRSATPKPATRERQPSSSSSATQHRYITAAVRRGVWQRDDARCTYVDSRGQRCREQGGLEFHHQCPHARGGAPSVDNLTLRCRSHNTLAAEQDFGRDLVRERRAGHQRRDRAGAVIAGPILAAGGACRSEPP